MKKFSALLCLTLLVAQIGNAQVVFDTAPNVQDPLIVTLTGRSGTQYARTGYADINGNERAATIIISENLKTETPKVLKLYIYNSAHRFIGETQFSGFDITRLENILSRLSKDCPVSLEVNRADGRVVRITPTCDELAVFDDSSIRNG